MGLLIYLGDHLINEINHRGMLKIIYIYFGNVEYE